MLIEATAAFEQSMRSAISARDRSVVDKSALTFSIVSGERYIPLRGIRTILDANCRSKFCAPAGPRRLTYDPAGGVPPYPGGKRQWGNLRRVAFILWI